MSAPSNLYLGIDSGTTNSAAAVFDGTTVTPIRNAQGNTLTPSVVRIDARGNVTVGAKARRFLDSDPKNTRGEFKRLMGTQHLLELGPNAGTKRPEELAAEVLKSIRADVRDQLGFLPEQAVISVPALFEVAQTAATSEAARLAGFTRVEMIQEPVASAIAAGWSAENEDDSWLVYDLGGGTFDVTLLATNEGLLRVVGHDGDNFLGGRDFDAKIAEWILADLRRTQGIAIDPADPANAAALRKLRHAAEEAKIELARAKEATVTLAELFTHQGAPVDIDATITRATLDAIAAPLVDRTLAVCRRLLEAHGAPRLRHVVLVGGPTAMPLLRTRVAEALGAPFREGLDPMTLVAQGAALYAGTTQLDARRGASESSNASATSGPRVWLQFPAMTPDLAPFVVGKMIDVSSSGVSRVSRVSRISHVTHVALTRADGAWASEPEAVDAEGAFALQVSLTARAPNVFRTEGIDAAGARTPLHPPSFTIVHGVTIGDPPLSRSIGVALANDGVQVYFERGSPLPMRRTFTLRTVETVASGLEGFALRVPIVQGEFPLAHLCRLVGTLEIPSQEVKATLPAGSPIEVTLELDRGGRLTASARVAALGQLFDQVAHLVAPHVPAPELAARAEALLARRDTLRGDAMKRGMGASIITRLAPIDALFDDLRREIELARGGDADAAEKARRALLEIDAGMAEIDADLAWPALEAEVRTKIATAMSWIASQGTEAEQRIARETIAAVEKARMAKDAREVQRQLRIVENLGGAAYFRLPEAWERELHFAEARVSEATNVRRAMELVRDGRLALDKGDRAGLERAIRELWTLMPADEEERRLGHSSGVR